MISDKCSICLKSRPIVSENGIHYSCCLSDKKAIECLIGKKDYSVIIKREKMNEGVDCAID